MTVSLPDGKCYPFAMRPTAYPFLENDTLTVARNLLGMQLKTVHGSAVTTGRIVEVEAYGPVKDEACHAARGMTARNAAMFKAAGHCYVYFIYGVHYCVNVVTEPEGIGAAVLIRALEPIEGLSIMRQRRGVESVQTLTNGPGKLCQALAIGPEHNGLDLYQSTTISLLPGSLESGEAVVQSPRIGITKNVDLPWRFFIADNPFVSRSRLQVANY